MLASIDLEDLRATVETLSAIDRPSASEGERHAAVWIADRLRQEGCDVWIDTEQAYCGYARSIGGQVAIGAVGGGLVAAAGRRRHGLRAVGGALAAAATAGIAEDVSNGPQIFRRIAMHRRETWNVVAETGDRDAARTLLVLAHHDAASSGMIFDQTVHQAFAARFPDLIERIDTAIPMWWPVAAGPLLGVAGALTGRSRVALAGAVLAAASTAAFVDIERSPTVPGANDNLSAVAALVALARAVRERPVTGVRVLLVSCGAEESLQGGIRAFAARRFGDLDPATTSVFNMDTIGSPHLIMIEGEGPFVMEDYADPAWRDRVAEAAQRIGVPLRRGMRSRASTDSVIPSRAGYPTVTLASVDKAKALSNYHLMSDTAENVEYETVAGATAICETVARDLAAEA
jgi:Zn-dependent M28 family amino/carboxypeptidase